MERKSDASANRTYDEFDPRSSSKAEQGFDTITVFLPGFKKEQLKVQVTTTRKLRVAGERPVGANKWLRFSKEFPLESNVDVDSISAKFEGANLVVKVPRYEQKGNQTSSPKPDEVSKVPPVDEVQQTPRFDPLKPPRGKEAEVENQAEKKEASKISDKEKSCVGGYVTKMTTDKKQMTLAMVAAVLSLSIGFFAGRTLNY